MNKAMSSAVKPLIDFSWDDLLDMFMHYDESFFFQATH